MSAESIRLASVPLERCIKERTLGQLESSLATSVASLTRKSVLRSLALMPFISECTDVAWALPTTERAMILCGAIKHLMRSLAGCIYFERKRPQILEESIVLLDRAGQVAVAGAGSRPEYPVLAGDTDLSQAIDHGDVLVTAGRLAQKASAVLRAWRERLCDASLSRAGSSASTPIVEFDDLMSTPGIFYDDASALKGKGSAYNQKQGKARLLAQLWAASRGEED